MRKVLKGIDMNCKPGDLAVVIRGGDRAAEANTGRLCEVVRPYPCIVNERFFWICKGNLVTPYGESVYLLGIDDASLRPIRDNDSEDETLTWAGKPHKETT